MKTALKKLVDRLRQPTTVVGVIALGTLFGLPAETLNHLGTAVVFVAGLAAVFLDEKPAVVLVAVDPLPAAAPTGAEGTTR
ncbi:hypothetical protein GN316_03025 [Xylophilus sp. Kf1]|nr:hypothetical protein [Xylophilus sp. Kf1]